MNKKLYPILNKALQDGEITLKGGWYEMFSDYRFS